MGRPGDFLRAVRGCAVDVCGEACFQGPGHVVPACGDVKRCHVDRFEPRIAAWIAVISGLFGIIGLLLALIGVSPLAIDLVEWWLREPPQYPYGT